MGVLYARVSGAWVPVVASGGGSNEVYVGTDDPIVTYPDAEIWFDSDAPAADIDPVRQWNSAWGTVARYVYSTDVTGITTTETWVNSGTYAGFLAGRRYRTFTRIAYSQTVASDTFFVRSYIGGSQMMHFVPEATATTRVYHVVSASTDMLVSGPQVVNATIVRSGGSGSASAQNAAYYNGILEVIDEGPTSPFVPPPNPTPAWTPVTFQNGWANYDAFRAAGYRKVGDCVEVRGSIMNGTANTAAFTLPVGFRPPRHLYLPILNNTTYTYAAVYADGTVFPMQSSAFIGLDAIRFSVTP